MSITPFVVDTDPGIDDAVALALLTQLVGKQLWGVITTYGNCSNEWAAANAAAILSLCGAASIPLVKGAKRPLCRPCEPAMETHGVDGLGFARSRYPGLCQKVDRSGNDQEWGPDAIIRWAKEARIYGGLTLICLGPLTNLALAVARDLESLLAGVKRVVIMGGSAGAAGNTTPVSEFNFWCDPEAARAVFASGLPIWMVGLDVTRKMVLPAQAVDKLHALAADTPIPDLIHLLTAAMHFYVDFHHRVEGLSGCILNDPLAVLLALDPSLAQARPMHVGIECGEGATRGQTICDWYGFTQRQPNAHVYHTVDGEKAMRLVWEVLAPSILTSEDLAITQ